ncbi:MAG: tRNA pseudouridine(38-40) synthase TruA [Spirochaetales bacterium]
MRRFRLDIAYDGTHFEGWQTQEHEARVGRTVQSDLEAAVETLVRHRVDVVGAGRTDSGVHARGQTAHFDAETRMQGVHFTRGLNSLLPPDVRITRCVEVGPGFHARFTALSRVYQYQMVVSPSLLPWEERYYHRLTTLPPLPQLNAMAGLLHGELDFTSFSQAKDPHRSRTRYIYHSVFYPQGDKVIYEIAGNAFLWRMVRSLVGTLLDFGARGWGPAEFRDALEAKDRRRAGPTAPAKGLYLHKVIYDEHELSF